MAEKKQTKRERELEQQLGELTLDLQRTRADFENYRKRIDSEKHAAMETGQASAIMKLLPAVDTIERATQHIPEDLADNNWVQGVAGLSKQLNKIFETLNLKRIDAKPGTVFDPELHEAIQFDEAAEGEHDVIESELQAGYQLAGSVIRPAMVRVTKQ